MALEQTIKQRLIGAIVLVALAVIFLPGILGQKTERKAFVTKVPEKQSAVPSQTHTKETSTEKPTPETHSAESQSGAEKAAQEAKEVSSKGTSPDKAGQNKAETNDTTKATREQPAQKSPATAKSTDKKTKSTPVEPPVNFKNDSWVIQVGSFSSHANAEILSKRLEEQGMKSFVRPVDLKDDKLLYRVYVGPWLDKPQATAALPKVTDITRLKPIVVKWQPNKQ